MSIGICYALGAGRTPASFRHFIPENAWNGKKSGEKFGTFEKSRTFALAKRKNAEIAQLVEHFIRNERVAG
ncbi:MAG: hypothetical protein ACI3YD_01280, partial [Alloprevotella sp.]